MKTPKEKISKQKTSKEKGRRINVEGKKIEKEK
jgi:hypothetical protein